MINVYVSAENNNKTIIIILIVVKTRTYWVFYRYLLAVMSSVIYAES